MEHVTPEKAVEVLQAIDYFQFSEGLRHACEAYLCTLIKKSTVCQLFHLANMCGSLFLKEECFDFLVSNYSIVSILPEYTALPDDLKEQIYDYVALSTAKKKAAKGTTVVSGGSRDKNFSLL
jgi:hypothetical protein